MSKLALIAIGGVVGAAITLGSQMLIGPHNSGAHMMHDMATNEADAPMDHSEMDHSDMDHSEMHENADGHSMHSHGNRDVAQGSPVPSVTHLVIADAMDGYNVQILPVNFEFAASNVNGEVHENEGHAHIYVNGVKISRVYGEWFHLSGALFQDGENQVRVTLNANDHSEWAVGGETVSSTVTVDQ